MGRLAVILGSSARGPGGGEVAAAATKHGAAIVQRHGESAYVLPHEIDHVANLQHLAEQGCDRVLAVGSVGSLRSELPVGSFVCPDDFIALHVGFSSLDDERGHSTPGFDSRWRAQVIAAWEAGGVTVRDGGVYWQTIGPRFETPAEIRLLAAHAHLVGMTIASECVIARELGLAYAAICVVDNLANGIGSDTLNVVKIEAQRAVNAERLRNALTVALPRLGAVG
jgi:5'-methylthioinosine phosphorylase